jgi:hypothetical protein
MPTIASISQQIWDMKYRLRGPANGAIAGEPIDKTIEDTWRRVARAVAAPEKDPEHWAERFYAAMSDFRFLPAGRVIAGAGAGRQVTLFNCFVMGAIPDDMGGIFAHLREAALTMQQGGGIGYDFSTLRPKGTIVKGVGADASGPLSFMDVWDSMCRTIMSAGYRRGAMMATLRCDHPDIEAFIEAKKEPGRLRMFNLSVLVTDAFIRPLPRTPRGSSPLAAPWPRSFPRASSGTRSCARPMPMPSRASSLSTASTSRTISGTARKSTRPTPAASSHCRRMAPAFWARSTWRGLSRTRLPGKRGSIPTGWRRLSRTQCG